jgi:hypothetical protein
MNGDDMLTAMARELITERGIGEPADVVWRQIQAEQGWSLPVPDATTEPGAVISLVSPAAFPRPPTLSIPAVVNALKLALRLPSGCLLRRKKSGDQLSLF